MQDNTMIQWEYPLKVPVTLNELEKLGYDTADLPERQYYCLYLSKGDCKRGLKRWLDDKVPSVPNGESIECVKHLEDKCVDDSHVRWCFERRYGTEAPRRPCLLYTSPSPRDS